MKTLEIKDEKVPVQHTSNQFSWNWRDFIKGAIMAVGTPVLYVVQELIPGWNIDPIAKAALAAFITYLLKNFFSPGQIVIEKKDLPA